MGSEFSDAIVLVTAAASGIGAATAEAFASEGARLMLGDINVEGGEQTAQRCRALGAEAQFLRTDATCEEDVERLVNATVDAYGGLTTAANVVGGSVGDAHGPQFHRYTKADFDATIGLCLGSVFLSMKHELTYMIEHGGGSIVNVASLCGLLYEPAGGAGYASGKAGVIHITRFAALTYADRGVRVNSISPGVTITPAYDRLEDAETHIERMLQSQAIHRVIQPSEQAAAILWLSSKHAAMVTGQDIRVDGGWSAR
jgi:NAD(P)-dependent dehydrogenase (short-subunit alcohol dehydrogenase family)